MICIAPNDSYGIHDGIVVCVGNIEDAVHIESWFI